MNGIDHDSLEAGRRAMVEAFKELLFLARRAQCDWERTAELQGRFFDGNVQLKTSLSSGHAERPAPAAITRETGGAS